MLGSPESSGYPTKVNSTIEELGPPPPFYEEDDEIDWRQEFAPRIQLLIQLIRTAQQSSLPVQGLAFYLGVLASQAHQEIDVHPVLDHPVLGRIIKRKPRALKAVVAYLKQLPEHKPQKTAEALWNDLPTTPARIEVDNDTFFLYREHDSLKGDILVQANEQVKPMGYIKYNTFRQYLSQVRTMMS